MDGVGQWFVPPLILEDGQQQRYSFGGRLTPGPLL